MVEPNRSVAGQRGRPSRAAVYERLRIQIGELRERLAVLPSPVEAQDIWRGIWLEEAPPHRCLNALRRADTGDPGPLGELLARAVLDNLYEFVVPAVAGPARLVPLPAFATEELSANALRFAATRGRLEAAKAADGSWRSSRAWVEEYRATRYKRS